VDGQPIKDTWELQKAVADKGPGSTVRLGVIRGKKPMEVTVKLGEMPDKYAGLETSKKPEENSVAGLLGLRVSEITPEVSRNVNLPQDKGVVVLDVAPDSPAAGQLQRGDVIVKINNREIKSLADYEDALGEARKAKAKFLIIRFARRTASGETVRSVIDVPVEW